MLALAWANSLWQHTYETLWANPVVLQLGDVRVADDLRHFVNDGLMAVFFFVVALEIKRELIRGELSSARVAMLPVFAALGGMIVPAGLYLLVTAGSGTARGWGLPMATDIAFALGVLALLARRLPGSLKLLLLTLAIVDDIARSSSSPSSTAVRWIPLRCSPRSRCSARRRATAREPDGDAAPFARLTAAGNAATNTALRQNALTDDGRASAGAFS